MESTQGDPRDWIARRRLHGLRLRGPGLATPADVVGQLTAMQAQEHAYARWSVAQRTAGSPASAVDSAFDQGRILRTHLLRPTWHYAAAEDLRWLMRLSGPRVDAVNARRYEELGLDAQTFNRSDDVIARAVSGPARTRRELAAILQGQGIPAAGGQRLAHMLMHAELATVICSGPMRGTQHTYAAFDQRVPAEHGFEGDEALAELAWRYFSTRGPATLSDFSWWSGVNAAEARQALEMVASRLASHDDDRRTYWFSEQGTPQPQQRIDLVQCYDELIISYSQTRDVLQTTSAAFPVPRHLDGFQHLLLLDGRLLGHWRARPDPDGARIETRTTRQLDNKEEIALADAIGRYRRFTQEPQPRRPR